MSGTGITSAAIKVTLLNSMNTHLNYPVVGILHVLETGMSGEILQATFKGERGAPVTVRNPVFVYGLA